MRIPTSWFIVKLISCVERLVEGTSSVNVRYVIIILNQLLTTRTLTKSNVFLLLLPPFLSELVESRLRENRISLTPLHFPFPLSLSGLKRVRVSIPSPDYSASVYPALLSLGSPWAGTDLAVKEKVEEVPFMA